MAIYPKGKLYLYVPFEFPSFEQMRAYLEKKEWKKIEPFGNQSYRYEDKEGNQIYIPEEKFSDFHHAIQNHFFMDLEVIEQRPSYLIYNEIVQI